MGRFSVEDSSDEDLGSKKRRLNLGEGENSESGEDEERESDDENEEHGVVSRSSCDRKLSFSIDTDVLDCSICFDPLCSPIFQCIKGHIACSSCCPKLLYKCPFCSHVIGRRRCLALEKVIESIKSRCQYARYGCKLTLSYTEKASHEATCGHAELFCPFTDCAFSGSKQLLAAHAECKHLKEVTKFLYNKPFTVNLPTGEPFMVLLAEDGHLFLLLNGFNTLNGNELSMICISVDSFGRVFKYELRVHGSEGSSLQLRSTAGKVKKWIGVHPNCAFLLVPKHFCISIEDIAVNICIQTSDI